jgi:hypothetical protein
LSPIHAIKRLCCLCLTHLRTKLLQYYGAPPTFTEWEDAGCEICRVTRRSSPLLQDALAPPAQTGLPISRCSEERLSCCTSPTARLADPVATSGLPNFNLHSSRGIRPQKVECLGLPTPDTQVITGRRPRRGCSSTSGLRSSPLQNSSRPGKRFLVSIWAGRSGHAANGKPYRGLSATTCLSRLVESVKHGR